MKQKNRNIFYGILWPLLATVAAHAQSPHPAFRQYTVEDGLPSSEVYQVKQDSKGYIWFATANGVSRFNGYEFENFSMKDGLPDNTVFEIFEDGHGRIWFLPLSCKLSYYYEGEIYPYPYNNLIHEKFANPIKTSFYVDLKGTVFMGLANNGIVEISAAGDMKVYPGRGVLYNVIEPGPGRFVYGVDGQSLDIGRFRTRLVNGSVKFPKIEGIRGLITRMITLRNGDIAVSHSKYLVIIHGENDVRSYLFPYRINWVYEDRDGDIWVGTYLGGVYHVSNRDFENKKCYLQNHTVDGVLQDREGGFWFATEDDHVFYAPSKKISTFDQTSGLKDDRVNCLATDGQNIYAGIKKGGMQQITRDMEVSIIPMGISIVNGDDEVTALYYDSTHHELMVSGRASIGKYSQKTKYVSIQQWNFFYRIVKDPENTYWCSFTNGLYSYHRDDQLQKSAKKAKRVNGLALRDAHNLWLGTVDGLWNFNTETYRTDYWGNRHPLLRSRIMDMEVWNDTILVMATKGAGVLVYDMHRVFQINSALGLCDDNVTEIFMDGPAVWVATNKGLNKITLYPGAHPRYSLLSYTTVEGLPSNEIKDVIRLNDNIWVAGNKGISYFNPNDVGNTHVDLPIRINRIQINDRDTVIKGSYRLPYNQNSLKIGFLALGYRNAGKLQYRYRMEGLDSNWTYTHNREIQFTTLPGGRYRFVVNVRNTDGSWDRNSAVLVFDIVIPFWKKWWFQWGVVAVLLLVVARIVQYRFRVSQREKEKNDALNRNLLNLKLKALRAQMNPHFTFNVMNSIQHFILHKDEEAAHRYLSKFSRLMRAILNNSEANSVPLAEEIKALELYLELECMRFEKKFEYEITVDETIDADEVMIPSMLIQPYVENAILHGILPSPNPGHVKIEIRKRERFLKCIIEDNGIGRAMAAENKRNRRHDHKSFGTSITKERLSAINELHNSFMSEDVIDLYDAEGHALGTRIVIYIPLIKVDAYESDHY